MFNVKQNMANAKALWETASWEDVATYIGPNADAYRATFDRHKASWAEKGRGPAFNLSWHWPAFIPIIGIPWAVARRQWLFAGLMVGVIVLANVVAALFPDSGTPFGFMMFLVPMMAKPFYVGTATAAVKKIRDATPPGSDPRAAIAAAGGLNMTHGYIAGAICAVLFALTIFSLVAG
jgi:hypothetical protein